MPIELITPNDPYDFKGCLEAWEKYELYVADVIEKKYKRKYTRNPDKYGIDLIWPIWNIEVKLDTKSVETWNFYFEVAYWLAPSWVLKYESMKYFVIWTYETFYLLEANELKNMLLSHWEPRYWWDNMKSYWYIVKESIVERCARVVYKKEQWENM